MSVPPAHCDYCYLERPDCEQRSIETGDGRRAFNVCAPCRRRYIGEKA